ncbi:MAG: ATP-binding protein, partial [Fibrobacter sp.]|nr:ATP-binding protein [Fibrobacter sp.]
MQPTTADAVTEPLLDEAFHLYYHAGSKARETEPTTVGIVGSRVSFVEYLQELYPNYKIISYDSPKDCLEHLDAGDVTYVFLSDRVAQDIIVSSGFESIVEMPMDEILIGMVIQFNGENADLLTSIVNKSLRSVDYSKVNDIYVQTALSTSPKVTLQSLIKENIILVTVTLVIVISLIVTGIVLVIYARNMRNQKKAVEKANRDRSDFFARVSHDMRTPMNGIIGMAELSKQETDPAILQSNMGDILDSGKYLLSLINDILDYQRNDSGKQQLNYEVYSSKKALDSVTEMIRQAAEKKEIDFEVINENVDLDSYIRVDPVRIKQVFVNLLNNAVKFTKNGGKITFTLRILSREKNISHAVISVEDTGIGMSEDFIKNHLYCPYSQEQNELTNQYAGTGLGLSIVKSLIEQMGGSIEVESKQGIGTKFSVFMDFMLVDKQNTSTQIKSDENK